MIARCDSCGAKFIRYGDSEEMNRPCDWCGGVIFWVTHIGFFGAKTHEIKLNIKTGELLTDDPCSVLRGAK